MHNEWRKEHLWGVQAWMVKWFRGVQFSPQNFEGGQSYLRLKMIIQLKLSKGDSYRKILRRILNLIVFQLTFIFKGGSRHRFLEFLTQFFLSHIFKRRGWKYNYVTSLRGNQPLKNSRECNCTLWARRHCRWALHWTKLQVRLFNHTA